MNSKGLTITTILIAAIAVVALSLTGILIYSYSDGTIIQDDTNFTEPNNTGTPVSPISGGPQNQTHLVCANRQCRAVAGAGPNLNGCTTINAACGGLGSGGGGSGGSGGSGSSGSSSSGTGSNNQAPIAIFEAIPSSGSAPLIVVFNATNSTDSDGSIVSYFWNFGDATNATGIVVNHTYPNPGVYNITLTVTDDDGATDSDNSTINVGDTLDTTPPQYSNIVALPASPASYSPGRIYNFSSIWTDDTSVHHVELVFNGVVYSTLNTGSLYAAQVPNLAVGTYSYFFRGYDAANNMNQTTPFTYSVVRNTTTLAFTVVPSNTVQQGTQTNVTGIGCPVGITCTLLRNGAPVSNPNVATLAVGSYIYNYSMSGNANYTSTSAVTTVTVTSLPTFLLTVTKNAVNGGQGTVTSNPSGINCGSDCTESYTQGTPVTLNAVASTGSTFTGWSGGGCSGTGSCIVTINSAQTVTATFSLDLPSPPHTLTATTVSSSALDLTWIDASNNEAGFTLERSTQSNFATITSIPLSAISGSGTQGTYRDSTGLSPNTQYFYRIKATNAAGTSPESNTASATTLPNPPSTPTNVRALTQSTSQIDISWNAVSGAASYRVYIDTNPTGPFLQFLTVLSGTSTQHTGLNPGTTQYYKVAAVNQGGQSPLSATINNSTIPNAPTGVAVTGTTTSSVSLSWTAATGATLYRVSRSLTSSGAYTSVGVVGATSFTDTSGLASNTQYFYRVSSMNQGGESTQSSTVNGTTQSNQFTLTVVRSGTGSGTVTSNPSGINCGTDCTESYTQGTPVTLNAVPDGSSTFAGWSGGGCSGTGACVVTMSQANTVTATFTLNPPQQFTLTVTKAGTGTGTVTSNPAGINCGSTCSALYNQNTQVTLSPSATGGSTFAGWTGACTGTGSCIVTMNSNQAVTATFTPPAPATPTNIQVITQSTSQIDVSWNAVSGATAYRVYPASNVNGPFSTFIFVSSGTSTPITGYNPGTTQFYKVSAVNTGGESSLSATFTNTTITSAPSGLTVTGTTTSSVSLSWSTTTGATSYRIYRSLSAGGSYSLVGTSATTSFTDSTGLNSNTQYFYRVSGVNQGGESAQSASTSGTTQANSFTLTVTKQSTNGGQGTVTSNPSGINCGSTCSASFTQGTPVTLTPSPSVGSTFTGWSGACSGTGSCQVTMNSAQTVTATFALAAPSPPTGMIATAISQTRIDVNWTDTSTNEANFILERATNNAFTTGLQTFTPAANVQSFSDTTLTANTQYFYRVRATNAAGTSANSNTASATTLANNFILTVTKIGTGSGTVTSNPAGINCGATCSAAYTQGTPVTLSQVAAGGSTFAGWSGACTGTGSCVVTMNSAQTVTATFNVAGGSAPTIAFSGATPANGATQTSTSVTVATTSSDTDQYYTMLDFNRDLALWMRMDDVASGDPQDLSSYDNDGTRSGNAAQTPSGKFGAAFNFDGAGDYVTVASPSGLDIGGGSFTFSAWVNPANVVAGAWQTIAEYDRLGNNWYGLWKSGNGNRFHFRVGDGSTGHDFTNTISNGQWYHVVAVYNQPTDTLTVYQNGVQDSTQSGAAGTWTATQSNLLIGGNPSSSEFFNGGIDEVMVFRRALSATEVSALFSAQSTAVTRSFTGLASPASYTYQAHAVDIQGQRGDTETRTLTIQPAPDTTPPGVTLSSPTNGITITSSQITFTATATDNQALKNATITVRRGATLVTQSTQTITGTSAPVSFANVPFTISGAHTWNVRVCDLSHNCFTSPDFNFTLTLPVCGNGIIEGSEQCDGSNLGGNTCSSVMGAGSTGTLSCTSSCTFNTQQCSTPPSTGWTVFTPSASSQIVYLSSNGSDSNNCVYTMPGGSRPFGGSDPFNPTNSITPCQSISGNYNNNAKIRPGQDDYLLLKRGDTWSNSGTLLSLTKSGFSNQRRQVIASWAPASTPNTQRPKVLHTGGGTPISSFAGFGNVALMDIYLYQNVADNAPIQYSTGIGLFNFCSGGGGTPFANILIENMRIERFAYNIALHHQNCLAHPSTNIAFRRNIIADAFNLPLPTIECNSNGNYDTGGIFAIGENYLFEGNILAHNGMHGTLVGYPPASCRNHNAYFSFTTGDMVNLTARDNFFIRGMDGGKFGAINGGDFINNTFIKNAISVLECCEQGQRFFDNVAIDGLDYAPSLARGWGFHLGGINSVVVSRNIFAHQRTGTGANAIPAMLLSGGTNSQLTNNIVYGWCGPVNRGTAITFESGSYPSSLTIANNQFQQVCPTGYAAGIYSGANVGATYRNNTYWSPNGPFLLSGGSYASWLSSSGENENTGTRLQQIPYDDPNRDAATYMNMLFGTNYAFGSEQGLKAFDDRLRNQSKWDWDPELTTIAFNNYIRDGFRTSADSGPGGVQMPPEEPTGSTVATSPQTPFEQLRERVRGWLGMTGAVTLGPDIPLGETTLVGHVVSNSNVRISDQKLLLSIIGLLVIAIALVIVTFSKGIKRKR